MFVNQYELKENRVVLPTGNAAIDCRIDYKFISKSLIIVILNLQFDYIIFQYNDNKSAFTITLSKL